MAAFVVVYAALTLTPFPASALTIASGLLFGLTVGAAVVVFAATIDAMLERRGLISVLLVRLVPLFPFMAVNYAAGLSAVRQRDYLLGTAVGIIPATVGYTALGAYGTSPLSWPFAAAVLAVVMVSLAAGYAARRLKNRTGADGDPLQQHSGEETVDHGDVRRLPS